MEHAQGSKLLMQIARLNKLDVIMKNVLQSDNSHDPARTPPRIKVQVVFYYEVIGKYYYSWNPNDSSHEKNWKI